VLLEAFGNRLRFPAEFAGRGDMSRGGLMLRQVDSGEELTYVPLACGTAARHGKRPPKLEPVKRAKEIEPRTEAAERGSRRGKTL
jgi:hypothetical protein